MNELDNIVSNAVKEYLKKEESQFFAEINRLIESGDLELIRHGPRVDKTSDMNYTLSGAVYIRMPKYEDLKIEYNKLVRELSEVKR